MGAIDSLLGPGSERLKAKIKDGIAFETAQVRTVDLDAIQKEAGAKWDAIAKRVREISFDFLSKRLLPDDIIVPAGNGFLIIFGDCNSRDLDREINALGDALNEFYLGTEGLNRLQARAHRQTVDAATLERIVDGTSAAEPRRQSVAFMPVWSIAREIVGAYFATPLSQGKRMLRSGYSPSFSRTGRHDGESFLNTDLELLTRAVAGADQVLRNGRPCVVGFSVHATTLQHRASWRTYELLLAETPGELRPFMSGKIAEIEPGTPIATITEWVARLTRIVGRVTLGLHWSDQALSNLSETRASSVAVSISPMAMAAPDYFGSCHKLISRWTPALHRQRIAFCIDEVSSTPVLAYACTVGVDLATGGDFCPAVDAPAGVLVLTRDAALSWKPPS